MIRINQPQVAFNDMSSEDQARLEAIRTAARQSAANRPVADKRRRRLQDDISVVDFVEAYLAERGGRAGPMQALLARYQQIQQDLPDTETPG